LDYKTRALGHRDTVGHIPHENPGDFNFQFDSLIIELWATEFQISTAIHW